MTTDPQHSPLEGVQINVSPDRMTVTLSIEPGAKVSVSDFITELRGLKLARFDDGLLIEALEKRGDGPMSIEVASGIAPVEDRPQRIEYWVHARGRSGSVQDSSAFLSGRSHRGGTFIANNRIQGRVRN